MTVHAYAAYKQFYHSVTTLLISEFSMPEHFSK